MSVTKERWARRTREKDAKKRAKNQGHLVLYLSASFALKAPNCTPFSGRRHQLHARGSTEEREDNLQRKGEADIYLLP